MTANENSSMPRIRVYTVSQMTIYAAETTRTMQLRTAITALFFWKPNRIHTVKEMGLHSTSEPGSFITSHVATSEPTHLLHIGIPSMIEDSDKRDVIRQTWARDAAALNVSLEFYLGTSNCSKINKQIRSEQKRHRDVTIVDHEDLWNNKVRKLFGAMADSVVDPHSAEYFAFVEDGTFVNVAELVKYLADRKKTLTRVDKLYGGRIVSNNGPVRQKTSIYYVPRSILPEEHFPPYAESVGFFMSRQVAVALCSQQDKRLMLHIDDVTVGCWLDRMEKEGRFKADYVDVGGRGIGPSGTLMIPGMSPEEMLDQYKSDPLHSVRMEQ